MCGISVILNFQKKFKEIEKFKLMNETIRHRGPDDEGYAFFSQESEYDFHIYGGKDTALSVYTAPFSYTPRQNIDTYELEIPDLFFAHRRLSIIDLSPAGHQPMSYHNNRYWIVFNGEIYNWKDLRKELESLGHTFLSQTDTEVILASYAQWGKECLRRFNGMWAFIIFDTETKILFAARDRFGIKPLYYWFSPEGFLSFASEIKQFTVLPGWKAVLNRKRAYDFLVSGLSDHTSETLFSGVYQLRGGEASEVNVNKIGTDLPRYVWYHPEMVPFKGTFSEASNTFKALFQDSVRLHLQADVPVGSCLSGGLDSSSIVCCAYDTLKVNTTDFDQKVFTAGSEIQAYDETEFVKAVCQDKSLKSFIVLPQVSQLLDELKKIIWVQDEPFSSTSAYAQWLVFRLAKSNEIKVMLDGQGADEQLCGYHIFFAYRYADLFRSLHWLTLIREITAAKKVHGHSYLFSVGTFVFSLCPTKCKKLGMLLLRRDIIRPRWINQELIPGTFDISRMSQWFQKGSILTCSLDQITRISLPTLLHLEDRNSMTHSVESRVPFLDHRIVELSLSLPEEFKIQNSTTKVILREAMKGVLPEKIRNRTDKMGFVTAERNWVLSDDPIVFRLMLQESIHVSQGIINESVLLEYDQMIKSHSRYQPFFWRIICFGEWMKTFSICLPNNQNCE